MQVYEDMVIVNLHTQDFKCRNVLSSGFSENATLSSRQISSLRPLSEEVRPFHENGETYSSAAGATILH